MAKTLAPYDPKPTMEVEFFGKLYHFTWRAGGFKRTRLTLHKGTADKCRRVHYYQDGDRG